MAFLTAERIVSAALGVLARDISLARLVWRDAAGDFAGAKNDTVSIRVPAYAPARTRDLRSGAARTRDTLNETKVDVTLDTDVYKDIRITDEVLTLDIADFGAQILNPAMAGIVEGLEQVLADKMVAATYANQIAFAYATGDAWRDIIVPAREFLNKAHVPQANRALAVGSSIETALLKTDLFVKASWSGGTTALVDATLGTKAGLTIVSSPVLPPDQAYAFHKTAYVMSERAPAVPRGAPFGESRSFDGFAMRVVEVLDSGTIEDILALDAYVGANVVADSGYFTADGVWVPASQALGAAVALANPSAALDDIIDTVAAHGFAAGDTVVFTALTGGAGLTVGQVYYVIAANLAATTFQVSATPGGAAVNFTTDITAGSVQSGGSARVVRAVKITGS